MRIIYALLAIVAGATSVGAADLRGSTKDVGADAPAIYQVSKSSFGGFFVGASVNWDRLDVEHEGSMNWEDCPNCSVQKPLNEYFGTKGGIAGNLPDISDKGIGGGLRGGYMFQAGRIYGGPVLMVDFSQVDETYATGKLSVGSDWRAAAVLKGGVEVIERVGVYGFVGVGMVDISVDGSIGGPVLGGETVSVMGYSDTVTAFTFGGGVDVKLTEHLSAFGEWQRFDLNSFGGSKGVDCFAFTHDGDANLDVVRVGLNYNF